LGAFATQFITIFLVTHVCVAIVVMLRLTTAG